jgi:hypothetical protein
VKYGLFKPIICLTLTGGKSDRNSGNEGDHIVQLDWDEMKYEKGQNRLTRCYGEWSAAF